MIHIAVEYFTVNLSWTLLKIYFSINLSNLYVYYMYYFVYIPGKTINSCI